jgi:hypothetical protein
MSLIDGQGRVFGRFNLVDTAALVFVLLLIPAGYATFLLFRPSKPAIESVTSVDITTEERRVASGSVLTAKLKVKGSGFNPLLRALIDGTPAVGLVFETPNSLDVLVGLVPAGKHDLVLYDGVQEVARAKGAVEVQANKGPSVRAYGWLTNLTREQSSAIKPGFASDPMAPGAFSVVTAGAEQTGRARLKIAEMAVDLPVPDRVERAVELLISCDWPSARSCTIGGENLSQPPPIAVILPGGMRFELDEIAPPGEARTGTARIQLTAPVTGMKVGDRDAIPSARAAEVIGIEGSLITVRLGLDESRDGWRYRGRPMLAGGPFTMKTAAYVAEGVIRSVTIDESPRR